MIVLINGAFGVGKTTAASILVERLGDALLFDPEEVGAMLERIVRPIETARDFQDLAAWRSLTIATARVLREVHARPMVLPMTIWNPGYFAEIRAGLESIDEVVDCVSLVSEPAILRERILGRPREEASREWCLDHLDQCDQAFATGRFGRRIETDHRSPSQVAEEIQADLPLPQ